MPRSARIHSPDSLVHVIARFANHEHVLDVPGARRAYLDRLERGLQDHDCLVLAYSLMSTHIHLAILTGQLDLGDLFESVHTAFAGWFRTREGGLGGVFAGRFKSIMFELEWAGILIPYVHNNEGRAGLVSDPAQSRWSSHRYYRGERHAPDWLHVHKGLELCGFEPTLKGIRAFDEWVRARSLDPRFETFGKNVDLEDRLAELSDNSVVLPRVSISGARRETLDPVVHQRWKGDATDAVTIAAGLFGVSVAELCSGQRYSPLPAARSTLILAWTRDLGRPQSEVARAIGLTSAAASKAFRRARNDATLSRRAAELARLIRTGLRVATGT